MMQCHSENHTVTCFKYRRRGSGKEACRFGIPRDPVTSSTVASFTFSQDISWIPTVSKPLALVFCITNYATKDDVSPEQLLSKAVLLQQFIEKAKATEAPTPSENKPGPTIIGTLQVTWLITKFNTCLSFVISVLRPYIFCLGEQLSSNIRLEGLYNEY